MCQLHGKEYTEADDKVRSPVDPSRNLVAQRQHVRLRPDNFFSLTARGQIARKSSFCSLYFLGLGTFFTGDDVKDDLVAFSKGFETFSEYRGVMDKHILSRFLGNKSQAFFIIPPFNFAFSHSLSPER
jgi:hypothetical protein